MSLRTLKLLTILLPPLLIGGFEYFRHDYMLGFMSMEAGNFYITLLTLLLSYLFGTWMFRKIERINGTLAEEQSKRAVYEDRERLAQELHDNLAQTLFFLNVALKQGRTDDAREAVSDIDLQLRQAIFNLRTEPESGTLFTDRLQEWLQDWSALTGTRVHSEINMPDHAFAAGEEVLLFGIVQEAFTNIRKHSRAVHAELQLYRDNGKWHLRICDDGIGFGQEQTTGRPAYGIPLMRKRAAELGAAFQITERAEGGTELAVTGPLQRSDGQ